MHSRPLSKWRLQSCPFSGRLEGSLRSSASVWLSCYHLREFRVFAWDAAWSQCCVHVSVMGGDPVLKIRIRWASNVQYPWEPLENVSGMGPWSSLAPSSCLCRILTPALLITGLFINFCPDADLQMEFTPFFKLLPKRSHMQRTCFCRRLYGRFEEMERFRVQQQYQPHRNAYWFFYS